MADARAHSTKCVHGDADPQSCEHRSVCIDGAYGRGQRGEWFVVSIKIECVVCSTPFRFLGIPGTGVPTTEVAVLNNEGCALGAMVEPSIGRLTIPENQLDV